MSLRDILAIIDLAITEGLTSPKVRDMLKDAAEELDRIIGPDSADDDEPQEVS